MVRRFSSICVWILCSLESAPSLLHSSSWRFSVSVTREVGSHSFQQTDTHIMLGPPLPPSSSHLPRSFSSAVLNEYPPPPPSSPPPPPSLSTHPPSDLSIHPGWVEVIMWSFEEAFVAFYCTCSNFPIHHPHPVTRTLLHIVLCSCGGVGCPQ